MTDVTVDHHFGVLGLQCSATLDDVKRSFKRAALAHHPEKFLVGVKTHINREVFENKHDAYQELMDHFHLPKSGQQVVKRRQSLESTVGETKCSNAVRKLAAEWANKPLSFEDKIAGIYDMTPSMLEALCDELGIEHVALMSRGSLRRALHVAIADIDAAVSIQKRIRGRQARARIPVTVPLQYGVFRGRKAALFARSLTRQGSLDATSVQDLDEDSAHEDEKPSSPTAGSGAKKSHPPVKFSDVDSVSSDEDKIGTRFCFYPSPETQLEQLFPRDESHIQSVQTFHVPNPPQEAVPRGASTFHAGQSAPDDTEPGEARKCSVCGKRMGYIRGMRGWGFRERWHEARCKAAYEASKNLELLKMSGENLLDLKGLSRLPVQSGTPYDIYRRDISPRKSEL